jgi:hypothetical protein
MGLKACIRLAFVSQTSSMPCALQGFQDLVGISCGSLPKLQHQQPMKLVWRMSRLSLGLIIRPPHQLFVPKFRIHKILSEKIFGSDGSRPFWG